jgi:hypothetical protein
MFEVSVEETFAAGHALRNYHGKCENVHGHNYRVAITAEGEDLNPATSMPSTRRPKILPSIFTMRSMPAWPRGRASAK